MQFAGYEKIPDPATAYPRVRATLGDAAVLAACVPAAVPDAVVTRADPDAAEWTAPPPVRLLSGRIITTLQIVERTEPRIVWQIHTHAPGATATARVVFAFTPSRLEWSGELTDVTGLLKMVPPAVLQSWTAATLARLWPEVWHRCRPQSDGD